MIFVRRGLALNRLLLLLQKIRKKKKTVIGIIIIVFVICSSLPVLDRRRHYIIYRDGVDVFSTRYKTNLSKIS